jgi:cellulose synthase/poly-beta-1,6-N-acetylglucosamine synthase-like glycosyltransferase
MIFVASIGIFFFTVYLCIILFIFKNWQRHYDNLDVTNEHKITFSIIIPMRNEVFNIEACLNAISNNDYPQTHYEIIVIDDHSEDGSALKVSNRAQPNNLKLLYAIREGKKAAITQAISQSKFQYIITLDADATPNPNWLKTISNYLIKNNCDVVAAPVIICPLQNAVQALQFFDVSATMAATAYGIDNNMFYLANGTNLIFRKILFDELQGYKGNEDIASGDDVFFINKAAKANKKISFIKNINAAVNTLPEKSFNSLLMQRKRWANKTQAYANKNIILLQSIIFLLCLTILIFLLCSPFSKHLMALSIALLISKLVVDYFFLNALSKHFLQVSSMKYFITSSFLFFFLILFSGYSALFPSPYTWRKRDYLDVK